MKLTIRARHLDLEPAQAAQLRRRVHAALDRLAAAIRAVEVTIVDVNGPKGGPDQQCRVRIRGREVGTIVIEQLGVDPLATVALATDRAPRATVRALARRRRFGPALAT